jgi:putative transposase
MNSRRWQNSIIAVDFPISLSLVAIHLPRRQGLSSGHSFRFNNPLYSLDASVIDPCLSVFPWADLRTTKGAIKLHVGLNHAGYLPEFVAITEGSTHEVNIGKLLNFPKGSIVVMDKGYNDYSCYKQLTDKGIFFVTRLKTNAKYRIVSCRTVLKNKGLTCDQTIEFSGAQTMKECSTQLRRNGFEDGLTGNITFF